MMILGSYDKTTKRLMHSIQPPLIRQYTDNKLMVYLLEDLITFDAIDIESGKTAMVVLDKSNEFQMTFFVFTDNEIVESDTLYSAYDESVVTGYLQQQYGITVTRTSSLLDALEFLCRLSIGTVVIRHEELTRGGELVELCVLVIRGYPSSRLLFARQKEIELSSMLKELLDKYRVKSFPYKTGQELQEGLSEFVSLRIGLTS
jgi:hypothetical protein